MGDSGPALEGIAAAFHDPKGYDVLPYRHNYTKEGTYVKTAYFIPAYTIVTAPGYVDKRGWTDPERGKEFYLKKRDAKVADPKGLMLYSAEYCFTPDEALALEGDNQFNTVLLTDQLAAIKLHKLTPPELQPKWG
nr:MAG TPA: Terminase large subunit [Bacteriophage sp.]